MVVNPPRWYLQERKIYEMRPEDQIRACREFKAAGNLFFKEGQWFRAAEKYRMVRDPVQARLRRVLF